MSTTRPDLFAASRTSPTSPVNVQWKRYFATALIVAGCAALGWGSQKAGLATSNIAMIFLAAVAVVAARFGRGPAIASAVCSTLVFDFFFVPPTFTFARSDTQYIITLGVMLGIGILISELTARLQSQLRASRQQQQQTEELFRSSQRQERRTTLLYRMAQQLSELAGTEFLVPRAGRQLTKLFDGEVLLYLSNSDGELQLRFGEESLAQLAANVSAAQWVVRNRRLAGLSTEIASDASALFIPMASSQRIVGVLGVQPKDARCLLDVEECRMLQTVASLIALSIERDETRVEAQQAQLRVQAEQFRNSLLSSVSHDLRTPLAMIAVTASSLLENSTDHSPAASREMLETVVIESHRLARQVDNLLEMARLNSGTLTLHREWQVLEELVGIVLARIRDELQGHTVHVDIPADLPLLWVTAELIERVLTNLLENAVRYTPAGSHLEITARHLGDTVEIVVADNGPGLTPGTELKVFDMFYRGNKIVADGQRGIGLGLPICKGLVQAHAGQIHAANRPTGGAQFVISLPCPRENSSAIPTGDALADCNS
jgi:two-component system sensor histidine kinase KdpD